MRRLVFLSKPLIAFKVINNTLNEKKKKVEERDLEFSITCEITLMFSVLRKLL